MSSQLKRNPKWAYEQKQKTLPPKKQTQKKSINKIGSQDFDGHNQIDEQPETQSMIELPIEPNECSPAEL